MRPVVLAPLALRTPGTLNAGRGAKARRARRRVRRLAARARIGSRTLALTRAAARVSSSRPVERVTRRMVSGHRYICARQKLSFPTLLCYHGSIMKKREGVTEKISISLSRSDLASLKKRAKRLYSGNVSAVISELAADAALLEGMHELVNWLGGPSLTDRERKAIDREWSSKSRVPKRARKSKKAA